MTLTKTDKIQTYLVSVKYQISCSQCAIRNLIHNCISQAEMEFSRITYFLFILPIAVAVVELGDFYPYGSSNGDTVMTHNDDGSSGIINITFPFPFFDQNHNSLYVSNDFNELILIYCSV